MMTIELKKLQSHNPMDGSIELWANRDDNITSWIYNLYIIKIKNNYRKFNIYN